MCFANCPVTAFEVSEMETEIYGRNRDESEAEIGVKTGVYAVRAKDETIMEHAQDGGAVTAIISQFLTDGGEGAIVAGLEDEALWVPKPVVVTTKEEAEAGAGTKYTSSPTILGVDSAVFEHKMKKIAVVGTPCQIRGLAKISTGRFSEVDIRDALDLKVGLFCMETFNHASLLEYLENNEVDISKVDKFEIKNGRFIVKQDGETVHRARLRKVKDLVRGCCHSCGDFTSEFADVSVGNVGSQDGWSTVIVRTKRGEKVLIDAEKKGKIEIIPVDIGDKSFEIVKKLATMKKDNATKYMEALE
jgi:coenzyme F420 hydrogenase subunit beta